MNPCLEIAPTGRRIALMDYLKGFSIATIVLMHLLGLMASVPPKIITLSAIGGTGVHVFFLCSGIGLYFSHLRSPLGFSAFLKKRFSRIYLPYILVVLLSFFLPWMYSGADRTAALLSHVFLFKMFVPRFEESFGLQFWFVSTLFQLYVLFIPMCRLREKLRSGGLFFGLFAGISVLWWIFCYLAGLDQIRIWGSFCLQYIWEFALGFLIAEAFAAGKSFRIPTVWLPVLAVAGISLQAGPALFSETLKLFNDIPALVGYGSLALVLSRIPFVRTLCEKISAFSYELFLIHMLVFETVFYLAKPQGLVMDCLWGGVCMASALAGAYLFHRAVETISRKAAGARQ